MFALLRTVVHLCVSVHDKSSLSVHGALHILVGSPGSCSVLLLPVATLPSAGRTKSPLLIPIRGKHFVIFILLSILWGSSNKYGAECRVTWGEASSGFAEKNEVWHGL